MRRLARIVVLALLLGAYANPARADIITFSNVIGNGAFTFDATFLNDNDVALLAFSVAQAGTTFSLQTTSYANGGFDPYLVLLDSLNHDVVLYDDPIQGGLAPAFGQNLDPDTNNYDDFLSLTLGTGSYMLAVMQFPNDFTGFAEVGGTLIPTFGLDDSPNFTSEFFGGLAPCTTFINGPDDCRSGTFAITGALTPPTPPQASVPEPATLTLFGLGAACAALRNIRRRRPPSTH